MTTASDSRSLISLLLEISHNLEALMRSEVRLAKSEVRIVAQSYSAPLKWLFVGAVLLLYAGGLLLLSLIQGLSLVMPTWASCLLVGGILTVVGGAIFTKGRSRLPLTRAESEAEHIAKAGE